MFNNCSIWFNAVVRGDVHKIRIGDNVNIQDNAVVHCTYKKASVKIGNNVSIAHSAIIHGCTIYNNVLIGMGAIIMDGVIIESNCFLKDCIIRSGTIIKSHSRLNGCEININSSIGPYSLRQIIKDYAEMMSYTEGTFFKLQNKDGSFTNFKVVDAKGNVIMVDGKAMGGSVKKYDKGSPGGVRGPGTKTSDSIPAMLSDGEWVIKADSVEKAKKESKHIICYGAPAKGNTL